MTASKAQIMMALRDGKITRKEARVYLKKMYGDSLTKAQMKHWRVPTVITVLMIVAVVGLSFAPVNPTGFFTYQNLSDNETEESAPEVHPSLDVPDSTTGESRARAVRQLG